MKEHVYKDCIILEYADGNFLATAVDEYGDPISKTVESLDAAKRWIDHVETIVNTVTEDY